MADRPFTHDDLTSGTWARLTEYLTARRERLRDELEKDLDAVETAEVRGRISEVRALLEINRQQPTFMNASAAESRPAHRRN